jgi:curli biogenesis system outer membrane secretion channel CsgG
MHRLIALAVLLPLAAACGGKTVRKEEEVVSAKQRPPKPEGTRKKIAVAEFADKSQYGRGRLGTSASDILTTFLVESEQFEVYERQQLAKVLDEQKLGGSGIVDPSTAAQVGKVMGVNYIVYGVVSNYGQRPTSGDYLVVKQKRYEGECTVDVRMIDTTTGRILYSKTGRGTAERSYTKVIGMGEGGGYDETLAGDSLRAAIAKMIDNLIDAAP